MKKGNIALYLPVTKTIKVVLLVILGFSVRSLNGQRASGIFKTSSDFLEGTVFSADKAGKLHLHDVIRRNYVDIVHGDSNYRFPKNDLYGYCDKGGNVYRFYHNDIYPVMNRDEHILIYKITKGTGLKNSPVTEAWFFSKDAGSGILPLTMANLLIVFHENKSFTGLLEVYCHNNAELTDYDQTYGMYKLNRLLEISTQLK